MECFLAVGKGGDRTLSPRIADGRQAPEAMFMVVKAGYVFDTAADGNGLTGYDETGKHISIETFAAVIRIFNSGFAFQPSERIDHRYRCRYWSGRIRG